MICTSISSRVPADFDYTATVDSHGWRDLAPFRYDRDTKTLHRRHRLRDGTPVLWQIQESADGLQITLESEAALTAAHLDETRRDVLRVFALDWNPAPFYAALRDQPRYAWVEAGRHGRLLVAPTVWEDVVKTLLTTNTTWAQTKNMAARLCALDDGFFPSAPLIAGYTAADLAAQTGMGYRAAYLIGLAERIAGGTLDVEAWRTTPSDEIVRALKGIKGFGAYATGTILRLLHHHDALAIDTVARAAFKQLSGGDDAADATLHAYYAPFGMWRGLVLWMDCIRDERNG